MSSLFYTNSSNASVVLEMLDNHGYWQKVRILNPGESHTTQKCMKGTIYKIVDAGGRELGRHRVMDAYDKVSGDVSHNDQIDVLSDSSLKVTSKSAASIPAHQLTASVPASRASGDSPFYKKLWFWILATGIILLVGSITYNMYKTS